MTASLSFLDKLIESKVAISETFPEAADIGVVCGSGLGEVFLSSVEIIGRRSYAEIPHWPNVCVKGHSGELIQGNFQGKKIWILRGRSHLYEGLEAWEVTCPLRVLSDLGLKKIILTNACGSLSPEIHLGDMVLLNDQINLTGCNRVFHPGDPKIIDPFLDASQVFDLEWLESVKKFAQGKSLPVKQGVYFGVKGPCYETLAEVKMFRQWGGDVVGMSTVCEALMAKYLGMSTLGISCVSNEAPKPGEKLNVTHEMVLAEMKRVDDKLAELLREAIF